MKTLRNGVVLSNELFIEYQNYLSGSADYSRDLLKKILSFHFDGFVSNVKQYQDCGVIIPKDIESAMRQSGLVDQTLGDLARDYTIYKIILTNNPDKHNFPYVNINDKEENVSVSVTGCFKVAERRSKAVEHIAALCSGAKELIIYDKYLNNTDRGVLDRIESVLDRIIPQTTVKVFYDTLLTRSIKYLSNACQHRSFEKKNFSDLHDRYIVIDKRIEVMLSSGFDHLSFDNGKELTYVIRSINKKTLRLSAR